MNSFDFGARYAYMPIYIIWDLQNYSMNLHITEQIYLWTSLVLHLCSRQYQVTVIAWFKESEGQYCSQVVSGPTCACLFVYCHWHLCNSFISGSHLATIFYLFHLQISEFLGHSQVDRLWYYACNLMDDAWCSWLMSSNLKLQGKN